MANAPVPRPRNTTSNAARGAVRRDLPSVLLALMALGLLCAAVFLRDPTQKPAVTATHALATPLSRITLEASALAPTPGQPVTWGVLETNYDLDDETLRRSLTATFNRPFSLEEARAYKRTALPQSITLVVRDENVRGDAGD
ncbi:MAG TPA: hypothetical protein VG407_03245 [Caulobacteraceae bacterium]|jgi:hypothetical protein|nr:hypothetical protein [Caulobacteraceae bacterium]